MVDPGTDFNRHDERVRLGTAELTVARWGPGPAEIVLLHDGLGSIDQWRRIPADLAARTGKTVLAYDRPGHGSSTPVPTGKTVLAYDRPGHGSSTPVPTGPWPADWLHTEADRLSSLLDRLEVIDPLLVGHSDGGSIALLHAAAADRPIRGLLTLAAHTWVEQTCFDAIAAMRANHQPIITGLARSNQHPEALFEAWSGVWVSDAFRPWNVLSQLGSITCPTVVAQGAADEYAGPGHAVDTAAAIGANAEHRLLDGLGHLLHHQDPDRIVDLVADFDRAVG